MNLIKNSDKILDTGIETQTGGRIKETIKHIEEDYFHLTYGDGVANVDIKELEKDFILKMKQLQLLQL